MPSIRTLGFTLVALLGTSSCRSFTPSETEIRQGIGSAIQASSHSDYTKKGCLASLQLWADEKEPPKFAKSDLRSALFFLGDSYLTYNFAFVGIEHNKPTLLRQVAEGPDQSYLSPDELSQLTSLVSASKRDKPPSQSSVSLHQVCVVFYTSGDGYFVVHPDEHHESERNTDAAIRFMSQVAPDAP